MSNNQIKKVEKITKKYLPKNSDENKFDELKRLDNKVSRTANVFAYTYGTIGSLILGTGMCFAMNVFNLSSLIASSIGIPVGILGIAIVMTAYPLFHKILAKRRERYSEEIIAKSNELLNI